MKINIFSYVIKYMKRNSNTKEKEINDRIMEEAIKLNKKGLTVTSVLLKEIENKKVMQEFSRSLYDITSSNCLSTLKTNHNCLAIFAGKKSSIVVIDIDKTNEENIMDGCKYWNDLIKKYGDIDTWKAKTGNEGYHYYFLYDDRTKNLKHRTTINGIKYSIDVKKDGIIYCPPTQYLSNDKLKKYEWINSPHDKELAKMPDWLFDILSGKENVISTQNLIG